LSGSEVFYLKSVLPVAGYVGRECEQIAVVTRFKNADRKILMTFRHFVLIEQQFGIFQSFRTAPEKVRILLAFPDHSPIPVSAVLIRNTRVVLLYSAEHLVVERIGEALILIRMKFCICIFGFEIFDDG